MGGMNSGSGWIQRVVAPWSYRDGNVLNAIVDPLNLTSWDEGKVANMGKGSKDTYDQTPTAEPVVPQDATAVAAAKASSKKRARAMSKSGTVYTNPLGLTDTAEISKTTLLGG